MDRIVRQIDPEERGPNKLAERRFSAFLTRPNIVLLGDPGAGKSHTFRDLAAACGGRYLTARSFLILPVRNTGEVLFIDGLDERRAGRGDRDTVDTLAAKLIEADPAAVRISCRVADWLGKSDLVSLGPFFEGRGGMAVLVLEALTPDERGAVLTDDGMPLAEADALLREAEERGLSEFLGNPQNLLLLRRTVKSGAWPATRSDLFEMATRLMLQEENSERTRTGGGVYTGQELRLPAGSALAARLISDIEAISLADQEGTETIPSYRTLPFFEPGQILAALGRRVFAAGPIPESVDYVHRTTAEYLGAAWLAQAIRAGLPIGRVVALMGVDGHPAPELRGLHAWLAVHLPEYAERLIDADPYGILTYGDAASLELLREVEFAAFRQDVVLSLLRDCPDTNTFPLRDLLLAALAMPPAHTALADLADHALNGSKQIDQPQLNLWLATAWLVSPDRYEAALQRVAQSSSEIVFDLRDLSGYSRDFAAALALSLKQIEFLIGLIGSLYLPTGYPSGVYGGDRNAWDAVDYLRSLINALSANGTNAATEALSRLVVDPTLAFDWRYSTPSPISARAGGRLNTIVPIGLGRCAPSTTSSQRLSVTSTRSWSSTLMICGNASRRRIPTSTVCSGTSTDTGGFCRPGRRRRAATT